MIIIVASRGILEGLVDVLSQGALVVGWDDASPILTLTRGGQDLTLASRHVMWREEIGSDGM